MAHLHNPPCFFIMSRLLLSLFLFAALPFSGTGAVIYVNQKAAGKNTGATWPDALNTVLAALQKAQSGDEIWVAKGIYNNWDGQGLALPYLKSGVRMLGGFQGTETLASQRDWEANLTVLTAFSLPDSFHFTRVLLCTNTDSSTVLDGFTIKKGIATASSVICEEQPWICCGGGLIIDGTIDPTRPTSLQLRNCRFVENGAGRSGGGIAINFSTGYGKIEIIHCAISENWSSLTNAAMHIDIGSTSPGSVKIIIDSCVFSRNKGYAGGGLGIYNLQDDINLHICNTQFIENKSIYANAGLHIGNASNAPIKIERCVFEGNQSGTLPFEPGTGGAILGGNFRVNQSMFINNGARWGGAIFAGPIEVTNSMFVGNHVSKSGGALLLTGISGEKNLLVNNTFVNNYSFENGGMMEHLNRVRDTMINCIFWNNRAVGSGDLIYSEGGLDLYMDHCLVDADSLADLRKGLFPLNPNVPYNYLSCGSNMLWNQNPLLRDTAKGDYRTLLASPAVNAGDSAWVQRLGLLYDLQGGPRTLGGLPNLGAYETGQFMPFVQKSDASCFGQADGQATAQPVGGFSPYQFYWSNGSNAPSIASLSPGAYTVTILDSDLLADTLSVSIAQPAPLSIAVVIVKASSATASDGSIAIQSAGGGTPPYQFKWSNGSEMKSITGLLPGTYDLTLTDANGCDTMISMEVTYTVDAIEPPLEGLSAVLNPNIAPSGDLVRLNLYAEEFGIWEYSITDILGRVYDRQIFEVPEGRSSRQLAGGLRSGAYLVHVKASGAKGSMALRLFIL